jgi:hypothetical protein
VAVGSELSQLAGYPFEVRYCDGSLVRARAAADVAANAYVYFSRLFSAAEPDIAIIVADEADWSGNGPYGLPFFRDDAGEIRPGIVLMPAGGGNFWTEIAQDLRDASPRGYAKLLVRRNPAAGEPPDARGAPNRGSGKSKACRSDARRGVQHARGAASPLHRW